MFATRRYGRCGNPPRVTGKARTRDLDCANTRCLFLCWLARRPSFVLSHASSVSGELHPTTSRLLEEVFPRKLSQLVPSFDTTGCTSNSSTVCVLNALRQQIGPVIQFLKRHNQRRVRVCLSVCLTPYILERLTSLQIIKFPTLYGTRKFITAFTTARYLSVSWVTPIPLPSMAFT